MLLSGAGAIFPFQSAFGITVLGLTASNVAASFTALQITVFLLKPTIGYIADYFNRLKLVIVGLAVLQIVFSLLLINIPNTGMPGIHTTEFTNTSVNNTYCQLCFNSDAFELLHPKRYLDKEKFKQASICLSNNLIQNTLINCPSKYIKSINFTDDSFKITQTICNLSYTDNILSENYTALDSLRTTEGDSVILFINASQISSLCLLPAENMSHNINFSSEFLIKYCYSLSNESFMQLKQTLPKPDFITNDCNDLNKRTSSELEDEHSIGIANFKTYQFWVYALCLVICCTVGSAEFTMSDTACYESIQGNDYGQQRVWGAISWGLMAPFAGFLNDYTESYMASWCIAACFTVLQIWNLSKMNLIKPDFSQNILKDMKTIFSSMEFLFFEVGVLLNGMFTGIIWYYLTWFVLSIGGNKLIIGLVHTMQCFLGEVPAMYFSGWLIKNLGHFNLVSLALISHGIRFFCYSYLHNPWWILPIECLHGLTFGSFYAAMTSYGKLNSKPGTEATTQSILCTTYEALGKQQLPILFLMHFMINAQ